MKKAEEVRLESGPERVETFIRDVQTLAKHVTALLDEVRFSAVMGAISPSGAHCAPQAMDILDQEADEDEAFRGSHSGAARLPSHEANKELIEKAEKYRAILQQAGDSDELVRQKWEEWEDNISQLTWSEVSDFHGRVSAWSLTNGLSG